MSAENPKNIRWHEQIGRNLQLRPTALLRSLLLRSSFQTERETLLQKLAPWFPHIDLQNLQPADLIRLPLQLLWLIVIRPQMPEKRHNATGFFRRTVVRLADTVHRFSKNCAPWIAAANRRIPRMLPDAEQIARLDAAAEWPLWQSPVLRYVSWSITGLLVFLCISTPLDTFSQIFFAAALFAMSLLLRRIEGTLASLAMISLSIIASSRYLWWRFSYTLNWDHLFDWIWGLMLLGAEIHTWLILVSGYIQTVQPLRRPLAVMTEDTNSWPTVDLFIPTYNEPLDLVRKTILAACEIDYPADRLNIWLLDDGRREEFRLFAESIGIHYLTRPDNRHAKAGNLNHALQRSTGEFVAIFDCDHIPVRSFLQTSLGWFLRDEKLALVQTPHHFYSADPFERNLGTFRVVPNEGELFYGLIQDGNDLWNATFFCGSCAVLRRTPLEEVGGVATETVTEDAHTALKLHRAGYRSAYINLSQAAGLATESLSAHIGQRIRWSRGMAQIFRLDNPFMGKGLSLAQRICYGNAMMHFFGGIPRLIFLTSPLAFLLFHAYVIYASPIAVMSYALLHIGIGSMTNSRIQGKYRYSFWGELYETVLSWYIARPTAAALINPHAGSFNVTAKGGLIEKDFFDLSISTPFISLIVANMVGLAAGGLRILEGPSDEISTVWLNMLWTFYNLLILGGAIFVASEAKQLRITHRVRMNLPAILHLPDGHLLRCTTEDISMGGAAIQLTNRQAARPGERVAVSLWRGEEEFVFPAEIIDTLDDRLRLRWNLEDSAQESALLQCTFGRADAWIDWSADRPFDRPLASLSEFLSSGLSGYRRLADHILMRLDKTDLYSQHKLKKISWWLPHRPDFSASGF